jgi:hypothetical protein
MPRLARVLAGVALVAALAACDKVHDDDDIVVTSQVLTVRGDACVVVGTVTNRTGDTLRVFLAFRAFDGDDDLVGTAEAEVRDLPGNGSRDFESSRFRALDGDLIPCSRIARVRRDEAVFED